MSTQTADIAAIKAAVEELLPMLTTSIADALHARLKADAATSEKEPEAEPLPIYLTQTQLARHLGVTPSAVHKRIARGKLKVNGAGRIPVAEARKLIDAKARRRVKNNPIKK